MADLVRNCMREATSATGASGGRGERGGVGGRGLGGEVGGPPHEPGDDPLGGDHQPPPAHKVGEGGAEPDVVGGRRAASHASGRN